MLHPVIKRGELGKIVNLFTAIVRLIPGKHERAGLELNLFTLTRFERHVTFLSTHRHTFRGFSVVHNYTKVAARMVLQVRPDAAHLVDGVYLDAFEYVSERQPGRIAG